QVVDEVDAAVLDLLVKAGPRHVVDERLPAFDRGRRQIGVEHGSVGAVVGVVHFQDAAAYRADALGRGDRNAFVAAAFAVDVVIVGDNGAAGQLEDLVATGRNPVAAVGFRPGDGALGMHLVGDRLELRPVLGGMPIKVIGVLLTVAVIDDIVDTQRSVSLGVSVADDPVPAQASSVIMMACSGQDRAASRTWSSRSTGTTSSIADEVPSISLS